MNIELSEKSVKIYVTGLDSSVKLIVAQIAQGNSLLTLKNLLPKLIEINDEALTLDKLLDMERKNGAS